MTTWNLKVKMPFNLLAYGTNLSRIDQGLYCTCVSKVFIKLVI